MSRTKLPEEFHEDFNAVAHDKVFYHTCQLLEEGGDYGFKPLGSGVLVNHNDKYFIFSAAHVLEAWNDRFIYTIIEGKPTQLTGISHASDYKITPSIDVGYILLDSRSVELLKLNYEFLPHWKVNLTPIHDDTTSYLTFGYPEVNIKVEGEIIRTGVSYYIHSDAKPKVYDYYKLNHLQHYVLEHAGKGFDVSTNERVVTNREPYGMSGCGLWYVSAYKADSSDQILFDYSLIGIMTDYNRGKYFVLIGNNVGLIIDAIEHFGDLKS